MSASGLASRLPLSLYPLIAEAKRRARQRRLLVAVAVLLVAGGAASGVALRSPARSAEGVRTVFVPRGRATSVAVVGRGRTIPYAIFTAVHGIPVGWAKAGKDWFVVYVDHRGTEWCGLGHDAWRVALVETTKLPVRVAAVRRISAASCGNELSWVRTGRFSDGLHREAAFLLWTSPALGATAYVYRVGGNHLHLLATFDGDRVTLSRGRAVVGFENTDRSPHGELEDIYRFAAGRYRLVRRR